MSFRSVVPALSACLLVGAAFAALAKGAIASAPILTNDESFLKGQGVALSVDALAEAVTEHSDPWVRVAAARVLGEREDQRALPALERAYRLDADAGVRSFALRSAVELGSETAIAEARRQFDEGSEIPKDQLGLILIRAEDASACAYFVSLVDESEASAGRLTVHGLANCLKGGIPQGDAFDSVVDALVKISRDEDARNRRYLILSLSHGFELKSEATRPLFQRIQEMSTSDPDEENRRHASYLLRSASLESDLVSRFFDMDQWRALGELSKGNLEPCEDFATTSRSEKYADRLLALGALAYCALEDCEDRSRSAKWAEALVGLSRDQSDDFRLRWVRTLDRRASCAVPPAVMERMRAMATADASESIRQEAGQILRRWVEEEER